MADEEFWDVIEHTVICRSLTLDDLFAAAIILRDMAIPRYDGAYYHAHVSPIHIRRIKADALNSAVCFHIERILRGRVMSTAKRVHRARLRSALKARRKLSSVEAVEAVEAANASARSWFESIGSPLPGVWMD